ncbi:hypothetical protein NKH61_05215 [Mesorhizobium sp. M1005]|uniref:hypothetical protein n=1 Tax=unclassified Mesorhizobium TaxID=325217 RepID=UPI003337D517
MLKITNTQAGPRGVNAIGGPVLLDPGQTVEVNVYAREKEHLEASGWFTIKGDYTSNPDTPASAPASGDSNKYLAAKAAEIEKVFSDREAASKASLEERDAEIAELRKQLAAKPSGGESERDELKKQADELGIEYAKNIPTDKLKELVDAKLAE